MEHVYLAEIEIEEEGDNESRVHLEGDNESGAPEEGDNKSDAPLEGDNETGVPLEGGENQKGNRYLRIAGVVAVGAIVGYVAVPLLVTATVSAAGFSGTGRVTLC